LTIVVVVSDTHIRRGSTRRLPDELYRVLGGADLVLHGGDVVVPEVLDDLSRFAPVHAVQGNNDVPELVAALPDQLELDVDGVHVGMIHDSGPSNGRANRVRRRFPDARVVVFGHSHIPLADDGVDGQLLFNPGSPTERRRQPFHTYGLLDVRDGELRRAQIVEIR
jgi:putative phosphoesterase